MKSGRLTAAVLSLILALTACGPEHNSDSSSPAQSAPVSQDSEIPAPVQIPFTLAYYPDYSIHPARAENRANHALVPLLYEGLFSVDASFQATPLLCRDYSASSDGLVWTFHLQENVLFSDGTPLTGELVAKALNLATASGARYHGRIPDLRSITGRGMQITITLNQPHGDLPTLLDIPIALGSGDIPPGTGPYLLMEDGEQPMIMARIDWWQDTAPAFPSIRLSPIQQADDLIAAFDSGEVTLLDADLTGTNALGYSGSYEAWDYSTTTLLYLGFNTVRGTCSDPQLRQAISRSIDRETIATIPYARHAAAATLPAHPDSPLYNRTLAAKGAYAPDALVSVLEAGPVSAPLKLVVNSENNAKVSAAQYIADQLEAAGLSVTLEKLPWDNYLSALAGGRFDLYLGEVMLTADFDLSALLRSDGPLNYGRWSDEQTDLMLTACRTTWGQQRLVSTAVLYDRLWEHTPIAPILFKNGSVLTQWGRLTGLQPRQNNIFYALENWTLDQ